MRKLVRTKADNYKTQLTSTEMHIDTHVSSSPTQTLALAIRDVLLRSRIPVLLGHAEIDRMDQVGRFGPWSTDEEIVWLDVSVNQVLLMNRLDSSDL